MRDHTKQGPAALAWSAWKDGQGTLDIQDMLRGMNAADAAIAELEVENARLHGLPSHDYSAEALLLQRAEKAEAALARKTEEWQFRLDAYRKEYRRANTAKAELAERDRMLELAAIRIAALMGRTTVDAVLADLRARAEEGSK